MKYDIAVKLVRNLAICTIILGMIYTITFPRSKQYKIISPVKPKTNIFKMFTPKIERKNVVYGYLPWWSLNDLDYIELDKLTDIAYFGVYLQSDGSFKKDLETGIHEPGYNRWVSDARLKEFITRAKKYNVRVALTLVAHEDEVTDKFLDCRPCWEKVANNLRAEMDKQGVKDLNLNFEYGGYTPREKADKYVEFVEYINKYMDVYYKDSFVVTSAFADSAMGDRVSSNIEGLGRVSDGIFIMGYDFHRPQSANAGPVAPLDDIEKTLGQFLSQTSADKLILGVPYYGYNWVVDSDVLGASRIEGNDSIGYSESQIYAGVIDTINETGAKVGWHSTGKTPYFSYVSPETGSVRQVHYENAESLKQKYQLSKRLNLQGVGIWALGYDRGHTELWDLLQQEFWN